jgi:hypothetical protein
MKPEGSVWLGHIARLCHNPKIPAWFERLHSLRSRNRSSSSKTRRSQPSASRAEALCSPNEPSFALQPEGSFTPADPAFHVQGPKTSLFPACFPSKSTETEVSLALDDLLLPFATRRSRRYRTSCPTPDAVRRRRLEPARLVAPSQVRRPGWLLPLAPLPAVPEGTPSSLSKTRRPRPGTHRSPKISVGCFRCLPAPRSSFRYPKATSSSASHYETSSASKLALSSFRTEVLSNSSTSARSVGGRSLRSNRTSG